MKLKNLNKTLNINFLNVMLSIKGEEQIDIWNKTGQDNNKETQNIKNKENQEPYFKYHNN